MIPHVSLIIQEMSLGLLLTLQARCVDTREDEQAVSVETQGPEKLKV